MHAQQHLSLFTAKQKWHINDFIAADPKHQEQIHPNIYRTTGLRKQLNDEVSICF